MTNIYIVPLERIDSRYTAQWYTSIPSDLRNTMQSRGISNVQVVNVDGVEPTVDATTSGAFLNFAHTNSFKATQVEAISHMFARGDVKAGDVFLFTDAWHFGITALRYMSELLDIPVGIMGIFHAGAYDPSDILGMKMSKPWPWHQERAWYYACDYVFYATDFHRQMFLNNLNIPLEDQYRAVVSGQPHSAIISHMEQVTSQAGVQSGVIWPHRYNADKQPMIAEDLSSSMSQPWCITQKMKLNKHEYYQTLADHRVMFSCSLHENLGISVMEGVLAGVIPVLPNRCSYQEMYLPEFLYPSEWTQDWNNYRKHKDELMQFIQHRLDNSHEYRDAMHKQTQILLREYLNADVMYRYMLNYVETHGTTK